jgi:mRNA-degrading endonuclease toxin of MazEF toxin-antitoxin module
VLSDQVKNLDWQARNAAKADRAPQTVVDEVLQKLGSLLS